MSSTMPGKSPANSTLVPPPSSSRGKSRESASSHCLREILAFVNFRQTCRPRRDAKGIVRPQFGVYL